LASLFGLHHRITATSPQSHAKDFTMHFSRLKRLTHLTRSAALTGSFIAAVAAVPGPLPAQTLPAFASQIDARAIAVISDGDFRASTYRDNRLADASADFRDVLTILQPGAAPKASPRAEVAVTNSVTGPPEVFALSPDGRFAYVAARLGQRTAASTVTRDLAPGTRVTAIDLSDPTRPRVASTAEAGPMIESVRVSPDGRHLVVTANSADQALVQIIPVSGGQLGAVQSFALGELGIKPTAGQARGGINATYAEWHPSGRAIAVNLNTRGEIAFFQVSAGTDGRMTLRPWGAPVAVGPDPFTGRFTPDGGHYVSANWGRDFNAKDLAGRLPAQPSGLSLIKLASKLTSPGAAGVEGAAARHDVVASVASYRSSEGLAISRDGRHIATVNMRETALAPDHPRYTKEASISYFNFDPVRSTLTKVGDYPFEGVLPEGGTFDASGKHFLATVFEYAGSDRQGGGIEVWRVGDARRPGLTHLGRIAVPHGAHHVEIVR
jgi:6-phosphogluconolactonase (cycloisomerase 2 family)